MEESELSERKFESKQSSYESFGITSVTIVQTKDGYWLYRLVTFIPSNLGLLSQDL